MAQTILSGLLIIYCKTTAKGISHLYAGKSNINTGKQYNETYNKNVKSYSYVVKLQTVQQWTVINFQLKIVSIYRLPLKMQYNALRPNAENIWPSESG